MSSLLLHKFTPFSYRSLTDLCGAKDIQQATASDPLSLEEEYAMQRTWRDDGDKLTFIVCRPFQPGLPKAEPESGPHRDSETLNKHGITVGGVPATVDAELGAMIGDVNLFISTLDDDVDEDSTQVDRPQTTGASTAPSIVGELELMIAERTQQGKGHGKAALLTFLDFVMCHEQAILEEFQRGFETNGETKPFPTHAGTASGSASTPSELKFDHFCVKIGETNVRSLALFEGLGFIKTSQQPSYFGEFELQLDREHVERLTRKLLTAASTTTSREQVGVVMRDYRCVCDTGVDAETSQ
jgi:hypothetical protein